MGSHTDISKISKKNGFILQFCQYLFPFLRKISIFSLIRFINRAFWARKHDISLKDCKRSFEADEEKPFTYEYIFPEMWALFNLLFSIFAGLLLCRIDFMPLQIFLLIYAAIRTFELFIYQVNVLLFDPIAASDKPYQIKSATRMVILLIMNMIEYTFWFSCIYSCLNYLVYGISLKNFVFILESFNAFSNLVTPKEIPFVHFQLLAFIETLVGMFMNLICLARFITLLPKVDEVDKHQSEQKAN